MAERKDLIAIGEMLSTLDPVDQDTDKQTDVQILQNIIKTLESLPLTNTKDQPTRNLKTLASYYNNNQFPDSLAFPKTIRDSQNLVENSEIWTDLRKFNDSLKTDYSCRRQMLINRLDCTVESFKWKASETRKQAHLDARGDKSSNKDRKSLNDMIHEKYDQARKGLTREPQITISHLLAMRESECDNLLNSVVSSKNLDCQVIYKNTKQQRQDNTGQLVNLKQIIIPEVPDRGGRTDEMRAPSKETFPQHHRGRGGRRRF